MLHKVEGLFPEVDYGLDDDPMGGKVVCGKNSFVICKEYAVILILFIDDFKEWWDNDHLSTRKCQV